VGITDNTTITDTIDPNSLTSSRYVYFTDMKTQAEAEAHCKIEGGHLAYFNNAGEQNLVEQWLVSEVSACSCSDCLQEVTGCLRRVSKPPLHNDPCHKHAAFTKCMQPSTPAAGPRLHTSAHCHADSLLTQPLQGYLLPTFHKVYWIGLKSEVLPAFSWIDKLIPGPNATSYRQWGTYIEGSLTESEPYGDTETCAVSNATQAYGSTPAVQPWGWASQDCEARHTYLCRQSRECLWLPAAAAGMPGLHAGSAFCMQLALMLLRREATQQQL
jgi:hypothetical protein